MAKYDATEMRAHLNEYLKEINDLMTTSESIEQYSNFWATLTAIQALTENLYTRRVLRSEDGQPLPGDGTFPPLEDAHKVVLEKQYQDAINQAGELIAGEDQGYLATRMRSIARELMPMMLADKTALDMVDVSEMSITLPELVGAARERAVDLGEQESVIAGGEMNSRQHMYVDSGSVGEDNEPALEEGYFTPEVRVEPRKEFDAAMERMMEKYPQYRPMLEEMRGADFNNVMSVYWERDFYDETNFVKDKSPEGLRAAMREKIRTQPLFNRVVRPETLAAAEKNDDFLAFYEDLQNNMRPARRLYRDYVGDDRNIEVAEGANIDKRNVAMYRMACLFDKPNLVAEAMPMTVIRNGVPVKGTMMAAAHGLDLNRIKPSDPEAGYDARNMENPPVYDDIAAMQALDFICGNTDRHIGNLVMQFEEGKGKDAKLTGLTLIDNDNSFSSGKKPGGQNYMVEPEQMGAVGEDFYNAMRLMSKAQMTMMLADCELSQQELDWAWERKERLQAKLEADREFYQDKEPGFLDKDHIRIVPQAEWKHYSLEKMAEMFPKSAFHQIHDDIPKSLKRRVEQYDKSTKAEANRKQIRDQVHRAVFGLPPEAEEEKKEVPVPTGKVVGSGLNPQPKAVPGEREDVVKLVIPSFSDAKYVGGQMSKRYLFTWKEGENTKEGFFTRPDTLSGRARMNRILDDGEEKYPQYSDVIDAIRTVYIRNDYEEIADIPAFEDMLKEGMGLPEERLEELRKDEEFKTVADSMIKNIGSIPNDMYNYLLLEADLKSGRIDTRNVAMSDVGDLMNVPNLLARSRIAQAECDGRIVEGVIMDKADGLLYDDILKGGTPMSNVKEDEINTAYNTKEGLKSVADLQILDYVCLNMDRHWGNMAYQFDPDTMQFKGVQGIDNDLSFGSRVPYLEEELSHLGQLDQMQVISAEMWEKIKDPNTEKELENKLRQDGLSDQEIEGARRRLQMVKTAVEDNTLRVVGADEWAKGDFTFEKLSEKEKTLFETVKRVANVAIKAKEKWEKLSPEEKEKSNKPLEFSECVKVDEFGENLMENKRLSELTEKTRADYRKQMDETLTAMPEPENVLTGKALVEHLQKSGKDLYTMLDKADPLFHGTSKEYKNLKRSCQELEKLAKEIGKNYKDDKTLLNEQDSARLQQKLTEISSRSTIYQTKKQREAESGRPLKGVGRLRVDVAKYVSAGVSGLTNSIDKTLTQQAVPKSPGEFLNKKIAKCKRELSGLKGLPLHRKVAELLNFRSLADMDDKQLKVNAEKIKKASMPDQVRKMADWMMEQPAFKNMIRKISDNDLRTMAAEKNGRRLFNRFLSTKAVEEKDAQKQEQQQKTVVPKKDKSQGVKTN